MLKRAEILDAALEVIAENGSRGALIRHIAERVGLTQAGLMHHFRSRDELFCAIIQARDERDEARYARAPVGIDGFLAVIEHNQHVPGLVQLFAEYAAEVAGDPRHPSREFFHRRYDALREALAGDVRIAQGSGQISPDACAADIAEQMIVAADGLQVQWLMDRNVDMAGRLRQLWRTLCAASFRAEDRHATT
ncbi:TetR/AcrR family transcriptional regulator [Microbacterium sp. 8M]|uniref:TetR/AcrR family transcriptional regulator n=1 Tax=Microbacterium sp. 8M TaxID=2653153 RepID=UPI001F2094B2|nr:TetR/AcrR family transcriptional regulator [Microbacterium sp. 8M]